MTLFDFKIDDEIKLIAFGKDDSGELKKKNYLYITNDDKIVIKGLRIIKSTASPISRRVLAILEPQILKSNNIKFPLVYIKQLVSELLEEDLGLLAVNYNVKEPHTYKSKSSIQCQIARAYGAGSHKLVPNWKVGAVGKSKKYCSIDDARELDLDDLFLDNVFLELAIFTENWEHPKLTKRKAKLLEKEKKQEKEELSQYF